MSASLVFNKDRLLQSALGGAIILSSLAVGNVALGLANAASQQETPEAVEKQKKFAKTLSDASPLLLLLGTLVLWYSIARLPVAGQYELFNPRTVLSTLGVIAAVAAVWLTFDSAKQGKKQPKSVTPLFVGGLLGVGLSLGVSPFSNFNLEAVFKTPNTFIGLSGALMLLLSLMAIGPREEKLGVCAGFTQPVMVGAAAMFAAANSYRSI